MPSQFRIGCQTYTWEMLGGDWSGTPDDIIAAVAAAGYDGVEFSNTMIGGYVAAPERFSRCSSSPARARTLSSEPPYFFRKRRSPSRRSRS